MRALPLHLSMGIALSLFGTSVFATTGTINFEGKITSSTCPIEIVNPGDGSIGNLVKMVDVEASRYTAVDQDRGGKPFSLRLTPDSGCGLAVPPDTNTATVTFSGLADGDHFAIRSSADAAQGVAIVIKDKTGSSVKNGDASAEYALSSTDPTDMQFEAFYRSTAANVKAGVASADIAFVVKIN